MENADYTLSAAVTEYVPIFYAPPVAEPDEFVLPDAPEPDAVSVGAMPMGEMAAVAEAPAPTLYWQEHYSGWGMVMLGDEEVSQLLYAFGGGQFLTIEGKFVTYDEWTELIA